MVLMKYNKHAAIKRLFYLRSNRMKSLIVDGSGILNSWKNIDWHVFCVAFTITARLTKLLPRNSSATNDD